MTTDTIDTTSYITVTDETDCIRVDLVETDEHGIQDNQEILVLYVTPYLTGPEARRIAERVATLASVNMAEDGKPIDWGTNY